MQDVTSEDLAKELDGLGEEYASFAQAPRDKKLDGSSLKRDFGESDKFKETTQYKGTSSFVL
jgi:hypothetical protein